MIPRSGCLLLFFFGYLLTGLLRADEESERADPDRFGVPLIRAWIPSTLVAQHQQFEEFIKQQVNPDHEADKRPQTDPAELATLTKREGILIYYDPEPYGQQTQRNLLSGRPRQTIPGHPWFKPVRFMKVGSREAFENELKDRTFLATDFFKSTLEADSNGFILKEKQPELPNIIFTPDGGHPIVKLQSDQAVNLWDVQPSRNLISYLNQTNRYWTYRDGCMFFGDFEEILTMEFPSPRDLEPKGTDADRDIFVQVDLNTVLPRQKRILWDIIRKELERNLQQYDDEGDAQYAFRKSVGDLQLNLLQAVTQELESIKLGIDFASEEKPAKAELEFIARPRVSLEHYFGKSGIGTPALASFVEEPAAMTVATSWGLPDRMVQTFEKFLEVIDATLDQQQGWTVDAILASQELALDLQETIRGNNQLAVKLTQSEHGFTFFGGIRIRNAERVSRNLAIILNGLTGADGWGVQQSRDSSGRTYYSYRPADLSPFVTNQRRDRFPGELHFIVVDEVLWFSVGRQDSLHVLAQSLDRIEEKMDQPIRTSIPLALIDVSLDQLFPQKSLNETKGFDRVPLALVEKLDSLIPRRGGLPNQAAVSQITFRPDGTNPSIASNEIGDSVVTIWDVEKPAQDPQRIQKFLQPDQSHVRIRFDAGEKCVTATATFGIGVIKHIYSRMMESRSLQLQTAVIYLSNGVLNQPDVQVKFAFPLSNVKGTIKIGE